MSGIGKLGQQKIKKPRGPVNTQQHPGRKNDDDARDPKEAKK